MASKMLSILLQRNDPGYAWGFTVREGLQEGVPVTIDQVTPGTLASQYLAPGDTILQIEKVDTSLLRKAQIEALIRQPKDSLDLLILKGTATPTPTPRNFRTFSRTARSPDAQYVEKQSRNQYVSSDSGTESMASTGRDSRGRKHDFWERIKSDRPEVCREGFTRLDSGTNSPFKHRLPRMDDWKRCQSEEKFSTKFDNYASSLSDSEERSREISDASYKSSTVRSIWSPTSSVTSKSPNLSSKTRDKNIGTYKEREGDITFWEYRSERESSEPRSFGSNSLNRTYTRKNSDLSQEYSRLSSEYASTPKSSVTSTESPSNFMRKPSDFWGDHYKDQQGRDRFNSLTSPKNLQNLWKNSNISTKTEFKKSTARSEKSYSSAEGTKSFETYEHVNKTKETERTSKTVDGGKEEVVEKTKKNKEYILANKEDLNGQPQESKKVINDFKIIEKRGDGDNQICNKVKERSEEVTNSSTPVNFYDNVQQHGIVDSPTVHTAEWCQHAVKRQKEMGLVENGEFKTVKDNADAGSTMSFSPLLDKDHEQKRWASSTPVSETVNLVYQQDDHLMENYLEVDIRSPLETQFYISEKDEILRRQSSQISGGGSPIPVSPHGDVQIAPPPPPPCPPAPPPPPPTGLSGSIPAVRLSSEIADKRRSAYEPPAAIQNAMMTKDKKPFTYTPGGLDLSEIRSPRMARRISRNANAPDMAPCQPPPSPLANQPLPPSAVAAMQPQIAIAVLPQGGGGSPKLHHVTPGGHSGPPPPPPQPKTHPVSPLAQNMASPPPQISQPPSPQKVQSQPISPQKIINRQPSPPPMAVPKLQPQHRHSKSEPQSTPGSIYVPPIEPQQPRAQLGSLYIPPLAPQEPMKPQSPVSQLNKAPTPWMSRQSQQVQKEVPPWVNKENAQSSSQQPQQQHNQNQQQPMTRIIPIQVEGKEPSQPNTRIIPIQMERTPSPQNSPVQNKQQPIYQQQPVYQQQQSYEQPNQGRQNPRWMNQQPVYVHNKFNQGSQSPIQTEQNYGDNQPSWRHSQSNGTMQSPGPVQSRSFKVLEKITGTDNGEVDQSDAPYNTQGMPLSQLRKLQLSEDDRALMNKVKSQVDDETYLHNESDPRYRGSAIPSRAFRILQSMTDGAGDDSDVPGSYSPTQSGQNRLAMNRTPQTDAPQQYIPPSEQQVQEPRKYTGGAIPSRSFRMLQAMTAGSESADRPGESEY